MGSYTRERMAEWLYQVCGIDTSWRQIFATVPREAFVPETTYRWDAEAGCWRPVRLGHESDEWRERLYGPNAFIVTAVSVDGIPLSSSSAPSVMARMLTALDLVPDSRVLEIGTGTGYNAALMAHRLGRGSVVTCEVDPAIADQAHMALLKGSLRVRVVTANGMFGAPEYAPYTRVISTCAVDHIPVDWLKQCPHGRIVAPFATSYVNSACAVLVVNNGRASGRFMGGFNFMRARGQELPEADPVTDADLESDEVRVSSTLLRPDRVTQDCDSDVAFVIGLMLPGCRSVSCVDDSGDYRLTLSDGAGSWARVDWTNDVEFPVYQFGPRNIWDEVATVYRWWSANGRPFMDRFGLTVTQDGTHTVWLDSPTTPVSIPELIP